MPPSWIDAEELRQRTLADAQHAHDNETPRERAFPTGKAEVEITISLEVEMDQDGKWRFQREMYYALPAAVHVWLTRNYGKDIQEALLADLDRQEREYGSDRE